MKRDVEDVGPEPEPALTIKEQVLSRAVDLLPVKWSPEWPTRSAFIAELERDYETLGPKLFEQLTHVGLNLGVVDGRWVTFEPLDSSHKIWRATPDTGPQS